MRAYCLNCGAQLTPPALAYCADCLTQRQPPHPRQSSPRLCQDCGLPISPQARRCTPCHLRVLRARHAGARTITLYTPPAPPRLKRYPSQPAIVGAPQHPDWQARVAWESCPQRWSTLRPAERRSA